MSLFSVCQRAGLALSPLKKMKLRQIDPAMVVGQSEKWSKAYGEIVLKHGGQ